MGKCASAMDATDIDAAKTEEVQEGAEGNQGRQQPNIQIKSGEQCDPEVLAHLRVVTLLNQLTANELRILGANLVEKQFSDGQRIIVEGTEGDEFFIIKEGVCVVTKRTETGKHDEVTRLKKGDYFGEGALMTHGKRAATITAVGAVVCLSLNRAQFTLLFGETKLKVTFVKRAAVSAEAYDPEKESAGPESGRARDKSQAQRDMLMRAVQKSILFNEMSQQQRALIVDAFWLKKVPNATSIIKQGDLGDHFYVVEKGRFDIFVKPPGKDARPNKVTTTGPGESFGENALLYNSPRKATVTAAEESEVWVLERWTFRKILTTGFRDKIREYEDFLKQVQSFAALLSEERAKVAEALEEVTFESGHDIIKEGDEGDTFFILVSGEVVVTKKQPDGTSKEVKRYYRGDYFGERALIKKEARAATCTTVSKTECLYLNRRAFERLLGPLEEIFADRVAGYNKTKTDDKGLSSGAATSGGTGAAGGEEDEEEEEDTSRRTTTSTNFAVAKHFNKSFKIEDLTCIGTLGKGSFGHVQLVKDKDDKTYALKTVSKSQIVKLGQQEHIMSEKRVMAVLDHPFLVKLYGTFKDKNFLYFLLEPSLGGELFSVLRSKTFFDEPTARFFAAAVVLAFEYMHSKNIIYRDLKPENLLLDERGYLKITDFGFAKVVKDRTWTLCGTPDYLAPEVVSGQGHNKGVDWWTLGILIYEMLASYPPFYDEDPMKTYAKIMHGQLAFPTHFSRPAVELIRKLLHHKPTKRLGVGKGGAKAIKENPWFKGLDWDAFLRKELKAPIVPDVRGPDDLSNFEEYPEEDEQFEEYQGDPTHPDWDADF